MGERRRRVFPETFKREAVDRIRTSGLPIVKASEELGLHETVLRYDGVAAAPRDAGGDAITCRSGG